MLQICPLYLQQSFLPSHPKNPLQHIQYNMFMSVFSAGLLATIKPQCPCPLLTVQADGIQHGRHSYILFAWHRLTVIELWPRTREVYVVFNDQRTETAVFSTEWVWKAACFTWIKQLLTLSQKRIFFGLVCCKNNRVNGFFFSPELSEFLVNAGY